MYKLKCRILFFVIALINLSFVSKAQSQKPDSTDLKCGIWALQFGISSNFTLTSFQGSTIGAKYQLSESRAIRGGITLNGNTSTSPTSNSGSINDSSAGTMSGNSSIKSANISFVIQYLWYMNPKAPVHLYAGFGPAVSYYYYHSSSENPYLNINGNNQGFWVLDNYNSVRTQWAAGGAASIGVEWFACRWLSLRADYNELIQYQWGSQSSNRMYKAVSNVNYISSSQSNSSTTKGWTLNSSSVNFGLNVYL
jgi:hypothetical protein